MTDEEKPYCVSGRTISFNGRPWVTEEVVVQALQGLSEEERASLTHIHMHKCSVSRFPLETLAELMPHVTQLDFNFNKLTELPHGLSRLTSLIDLQLIENQISRVPKCMSKMTQLKYLYLADNPIMRNMDRMFGYGNRMYEESVIQSFFSYCAEHSLVSVEQWTPGSHSLFPLAVRQQIITWLLLSNRMGAPHDVQLLVVPFIASGCW